MRYRGRKRIQEIGLMVDARAKGQRGEYLVRDMLRKHTRLSFERVIAVIKPVKPPPIMQIFCLSMFLFSTTSPNKSYLILVKSSRESLLGTII